MWTGDPVTATTTGRLAVPWQPPAEGPDDEARWLAVLPVWSHGPGDVPAPPRIRAVSIGFGRGTGGELPVRRPAGADLAGAAGHPVGDRPGPPGAAGDDPGR